MVSHGDGQPTDPVICGQPIQGKKHICAFVDSRDEQYEILMPFLRQGFEQSDRIISIVDTDHAEEYRCRCHDAGIDLAAHETSGKSPVLRFENTYLIDGQFSAERMLALIRQTVEDARKDGYSRIRGFGEMHWALRDLPGTDELIEYEARVNDIWDQYMDPMVCVYDVSKFGGRVLLDILATHPKVILGGKIVENPYYVPPKEFLASYRKRKLRCTAESSAFRS